MPLQSSGQISFSNINVELSRSATATISLDESAVRTLLQRSSGSISMNDAYGKSACPANGTYLSQYCSGYNLYYTYANGSCGSYDTLVETNSATCGYCAPSGTYLSNYCDGYSLYYTYANGSCGSYSTLVETNSTTCGYCAPNGTYLSQYCNGYDLYYTYANGGCGTYSNLVETNSTTCGYIPPGVCAGCSGATLVAEGCNSVLVTGATGSGGWGCSGTYTSDSSWGHIAVQQGLISSGQQTYVTLCKTGCSSSFSGCSANGVTTSSWSTSWCAVTCC